jgi:non-specific serine/threonine protein kinase
LDTSQKHTAILKVNYAPIEQYADAKDLQEGSWTDLYAVAAVMHGCICNEAPLPATFRAVRDRLPPFAQVAQTAETHFGQRYSEGFIRAVSRALAIEPTDRTPDVESFLQEVGMSAPPDLARFDWRKALGDSVTLVEPGTDRPPIRTELLTTQAMDEFPDTVFQPSEADHIKTMKVAPQHEASERPRGAKAAPPAGNARWMFAALAGGGIAVLAWWWWMPPANKPKESPVVTETAIPAPSAASEPVPATAKAGGLQPAPAAVPAAPAVAPNAGAKPTSSSQKAAALTKPAVPSSAQSVADRSAFSKAPSKLEAPVEEEKAIPLPQPVKGPLAACAEATILTRTMCIYRECQKPEFYNLPVCVADRKHWEERNKSLN